MRTSTAGRARLRPARTQRAGRPTAVPTQRPPEPRLDLVSNGPALEQEPAPGRRRRGLGLIGLLAAVGAAGAGWGLQQEQGQAPVLVSVQKAAPGQPSWGTLAADVPGTSCGALVDWTALSANRYGVERALPCADGSEVRASIALDDDQQHLRIRLVAHASALAAALPHAQR